MAGHEDLLGFRVGSVPYLNAAPLTWGIEGQIVRLPPSRLAAALHAGALDAALVSVTEVLLHPGYRVLDGWGIVSRGPVHSVILAHRDPLDAVRRVHVDTATCTSIRLFRILMAARGLRPEEVPLADYETSRSLPNVLLIGNPAIAFRRENPSRAVWDLGEAWQALTGLPFVYAVWAVREDCAGGPLPALLDRVARRGQTALETIRETVDGFDPAFLRAYLGGHVQYPLDGPARAGLQEFARRLREQGVPNVRDAVWCG